MWPLGLPEYPMKKIAKKKPNVKALAHWCALDIGQLMTVLVVGDPETAVKDLRKGGLCRNKDDAQIIRQMLNQQVEEYHPPHDRAYCNRTGNTLFNEECGVSVMWFPVVPEDATLAHEVLHCVQNLMHATGIEDEEFAAYTLALFFRHYQGRLREDQAKYEFTPSSEFTVKEK